MGYIQMRYQSIAKGMSEKYTRLFHVSLSEREMIRTYHDVPPPSFVVYIIVDIVCILWCLVY